MLSLVAAAYQIKQKEELLAAEKAKKTAGSSFDRQKLRAIAEAIRLYYQERKVSNLFVVKVLERLGKSAHLGLMERSQLLAYLKEIARKCPSWVSLLENPEGQILRQSEALSLAEVYKLLDN